MKYKLSHVLTLLYSERPKLDRVLAVLSAIGLINIKINPGLILTSLKMNCTERLTVKFALHFDLLFLYYIYLYMQEGQS